MMPWVLLADLVLVLHLGFILFAVLGGTLALRWPKAALLHLPTALYGVLIEFVGWPCPLTPLENRLREAGGQNGYDTGFIEHYLAPIIYPASFGPPLQIVLGSLALAVNVAIYAWVIRRWRRAGPGS
jgi:hypothetical protein